jgi:hypothetical protein
MPGLCFEAQTGLTANANGPYPVPRPDWAIRRELLAPLVRFHPRFNRGKDNGDRLE